MSESENPAVRGGARSSSLAEVKCSEDKRICAQNQAQNSKLAAAIEYATENGWKVFPAPAGEKKSHKSAEYSNDERWGATRDPKQIRKDWKRWPDANVGIPTGAENGFFVVEADTLKGHGVDGIASLRELEAKHGKLPDTLMAMSPSGSVHYYFKHRGGSLKIKCSTSEIAKGVDVKGDGGMVIAPPSSRADGEYVWLNHLEIADAPAWLELITERPRQLPAKASFPSNLPPPDIEEIRAAVRAIKNDETTSREKWYTVGFAIIHATGKSKEGLEIFDEYSKRYPAYNAEDTKEFYRTAKMPTEMDGMGWLVNSANRDDPNWREAAAWQIFCGRAS
jgi:Bifunctional DNA primase/polymerase, N-terminal/Primase C terminal 2 (PriCT-2)